MNTNQKIIMIVTGIIMLGMLVYPPFHLTIQKGTYNSGFGFIFDPPGYDGSSVNVIQLLIQELIVGIVGGLAYFTFKDKS